MKKLKYIQPVASTVHMDEDLLGNTIINKSKGDASAEDYQGKDTDHPGYDGPGSGDDMAKKNPWSAWDDLEDW